MLGNFITHYKKVTYLWKANQAYFKKDYTDMKSKLYLHEKSFKKKFKKAFKSKFHADE